MAQSRNKVPPLRSRRVAVERDLRTPMRDGVELLGNRWHAPGIEGAPVVLMRSPYGRGARFGGMARTFAQHGFQVFMQSCRGTAGSGGAFNPMRQERADGLDTVDWIRAQPWFGGKLFTFGGSYVGYTQWAIAKDAGEHIDGMAPQVTLSNFRDETLAYGGFTQEGALMWTSTIRAMASFWGLLQLLMPKSAKAQAKLHAHLPLNELDRIAVGETIPWWQDWVSHGEPSDPWWEEIDHSDGVATFAKPVAMVGGWRDIFLPFQVKDFETMQAKGRDVWLTIGPWRHAEMAGMNESLHQAIILFSAIRDGEAPPFAERGRVQLYVQGAETWRDYAAWPPPGSRREKLYLHANATLSPAQPSEASASTAYVYDPGDPTPALHGPKIMGGAKKPDMSPLERRSDTLSFTSAPLAADMEAIGPVSAELHVRSDRSHTDFYVCLCDVDAANRPMHVLDGYIRLRPNDAPAGDDGARRVLIECWPTAYRFKRGHRLRFIVASGAHPRYARNLGTGEPLGTGVNMVKARQDVLHDAAHPSALCVTLASANDRLPGA